MDKNTKLGIVIAIVIAIVGGTIYFNQGKWKVKSLEDMQNDLATKVLQKVYEMDEKKIEEESKKFLTTLPEFVKEYNATIAKKAQNAKKRIVKNEDGTEREVLPYTKKLPDMPDEEENNATLFGIDSNNNGVRDDLEISAVKMFGDDRDMVETVFADIRTNSYADYMAKKVVYSQTHISEKDIKKIDNDMDIAMACEFFYYEDMEYMSKQTKKLYKIQYNTPERKKIKLMMESEIWNYYPEGTLPTGTDKICKNYIEKTKSYKFSD